MVKSIQNQTVNQFHGFGENNKTVTIDQMYSSYNRYACCYYTDVKDIKKDCWKDLQLDFNYRKYYVRCVFNESARIVKPDYSLVPYCPNMEQQRVLAHLDLLDTRLKDLNYKFVHYDTEIKRYINNHHLSLVQELHSRFQLFYEQFFNLTLTAKKEPAVMLCQTNP